MKKQLFPFISLLLIVLALFGCDSKSVDLNIVLEDVNSSLSIQNVTTVNTVDDLKSYYQIDESDVSQFVCELSDDSTDIFELVVIRAVDAESAKNIAARLNNHYESLLNTASSYSPELTDVISNSGVRRNGVFVDLIVSDRYEEVAAVLDKYF